MAAAGLGFRAYRQHLAAETLAIRSPKGVQEGGFVDIGGIEQWVQIRGEDRDNPVLLFVHGGPGGSDLPISSGWRPGKSTSPSCNGTSAAPAGPMAPPGDSLAPTMTLERMTQDGVELAEYLRTHLHKDRIILVGHSLGLVPGNSYRQASARICFMPMSAPGKWSAGRLSRRHSRSRSRICNALAHPPAIAKPWRNWRRSLHSRP